MGLGRPDPGPVRPPTPEDLSVLAWQLGRPPRGVLAVYPCPYGFPRVILNRPLLPSQGDFEPMPTIFWLTCPFLVEEVSKLESAGAVKRYERMILESRELAEAYAQAHQAYKNERLSLLLPEELDLVRKKGLTSLLCTGIAGVSHPRRVKCLHAQLAHFLAGRENPIGQRVSQELSALFCPDVRCARALSAEQLSPR